MCAGTDPGKLKKLWFLGALLEQQSPLGMRDSDLLLFVDAFDVLVQRAHTHREASTQLFVRMHVTALTARTAVFCGTARGPDTACVQQWVCVSYACTGVRAASARVVTQSLRLLCPRAHPHHEQQHGWRRRRRSRQRGARRGRRGGRGGGGSGRAQLLAVATAGTRTELWQRAWRATARRQHGVHAQRELRGVRARRPCASESVALWLHSGRTHRAHAVMRCVPDRPCAHG
eukprot:2701453-Prymnesium_polylepis.2